MNGSDTLKVVALAAGAGGLGALRHVVAALPPRFPAAVIAVEESLPLRQFGTTEGGLLLPILKTGTSLHVKEAEDGEWLRPATVFLVPPGQHLLVNPDDIVSLYRPASFHHARPATDVLFTSMALTLKQRALVVILAGRAEGGCAGVKVIKEYGGQVIAQDLGAGQTARATPASPPSSDNASDHQSAQPSSPFSQFPKAAIETGAVDLLLPLHEIAGFLEKAVATAKAHD